MIKKYLKNIALVSVLATLLTSSFLPSVVTAQTIPGIGGKAVPVSDGSVLKAINGSGPTSVITNTVAEVRKNLDTACTKIITNIVNSGTDQFISSLNSSNFGLIGGSEAEGVLNKAQANLVKSALGCVTTYVNKLSNQDPTSLQDAQNLAREQQTFSSLRDTLSTKYDDLSARASASWKDVLRAIMVKTILTLNKNLTTSLVNKMIDKYKIDDFRSYADALGSQVYNMQYINENFSGDAARQMMIRSMLQSEKQPQKIKAVQALANAQAKTYLGNACGATASQQTQDLSSYISCMAAWGSPKADPGYIFDQVKSNADVAKQIGAASAAAEISQSQGFAPPRDCSGSLDLQKQNDATVEKVTQEFNIAVEANVALTAAAINKPGSVSSEELAKALADRNQAEANMQALPKAVSKPIVDICKAIVSPASFVSTSIGGFLKQHLDQSSQLKSDNLPFYANFLSDVAGNFLTNILTGGKSGTQILKSAASTAISSTIGDLSAAAKGGSDTTVTPASGAAKIYAISGNDQITSLIPGQTYTIVIDFDAVDVQSFHPYKIKVSGMGPGGTFERVMTGAEDSARKVQFSYVATSAKATLEVVFSAKGFEGQPDDTVSSSQTFSVAGAVKGASIILPRGPEISLR